MKHTFSYWERTAFVDDADVIIVGSGLVGLSAALHLKKQRPALKVLVVERGFLPAGASTKNAGFACFGTVSEQISSLGHSSEEKVLRMIDYKWQGLQRLRQNLGDSNIEYYQCGGYELFMDSEVDEAEKCLSQLNKLNTLLQQVIGHSNIYSEANDKIATFGFNKVSRMIYNPFEGQIHTGKMMRTLLNQVYNLDVIVFNGCEIYKIENESGHINLSTSQGNFKAGKVIMATNAFASQLFPEIKVTPARGQVLITKPIPGLKLKGNYHFDKGYYYFRNIDNRILFGGGRNLDFDTEETWDFGNTELVQKKLLGYLTEVILPDQHFEIDYWWSGIMGFGDDISPIVKQVEPGIFCAVRCNGMGVAMGSLVGEQVAELVIDSCL